MRIRGSILLIVLLFGTLHANDFDRYRTDLSLNDLTTGRYDKAERLIRTGDYPAAWESIRDCESDNPHHILLRLDILYRLGRYEEYIRTVQSQSQVFQEAWFPRYIYWYLQSCFILDYRLDEVKKSFREFDRLRTLKQMVELKQIFISLFLNGNFEQISSLLDMMPEGLFSRDEDRLVRAVANYYLGRIETSSAVFDSLMRESVSPVRTIAADYLSMISLEQNTEPNLPPDLETLSEDALIRFILFFMERNRYDTTEHLELFLPMTNRGNLCRTMLAIRQKHYRAADEIMRRVGETFIYNSALASLAKGELDYRFKRYESAVGNFKRFRELQPDSERYANYAIGWAYRGYYKYNSTAYYWIENLDTEEKWDSLANYHLADLYTFTKHHDVARKYFKKMFRQYDDLDHGFLIKYLDNLVALNYLKTLEAEAIRFRSDLTKDEFGRYMQILADHYYREDDFLKADELYALIESETTPDVHYRKEHSKYNLGAYETTEDFLLNYLEQYPDDPQSARISYDLIAYYMEQKQYGQLIGFTDSLLAKGIGDTDSIRYSRAIALHENGGDEEAVQILEVLIAPDSVRTNNHIRNRSLVLMEKVALGLDVRQVADIYSGLVSAVDDSLLYRNLLNSLAGIYEKRKLYAQANDIYYSFFDDTTHVDTSAIMLRIARNQVYQHAFDDASATLDSIAVRDSARFDSDVLFLRYAIQYGEKDFVGARQTLMAYYRKYPERAANAEIFRTLAKLYQDDDQPLPAWHFYKKVTRLPDYRENYEVELQLEALEKEIGEDTLQAYPPLDYENLLHQSELFSD